MSFPTITKPVKSPSLDEYDLPVFTDNLTNVLPIVGVVQPDANGVTGLVAANVTPVASSQVTSKRQAPQVGTNSIPTMALMSINPTTGALIPFKAASATAADSATTAGSATTATTATQATKVTGKFQSTVQTGTGSSQNIAHGLGVVPTLVLIAAYVTTDAGVVAAGYSIVEGAHDSTNVKVTATSALQYKVIAFA